MDINRLAQDRIAELEAQNRQYEERIKSQDDELTQMQSQLRVAQASLALMKLDRNVEID